MKASQLEILPNIEKKLNEKKSRWLTIIFLALTVVPSAIFWLISAFREGNIRFKNPLKSISFSEVELPKIELNDRAVQLSRWVVSDLSQLPGDWSVKVDFLETDFSWAFRETDQFTAASIIKLPIIASFYYQVEKGELDLSTTHVLKKEDKFSGAGSLQYQSIGTKFTLGQLAKIALSESDNTAAGILRKLTGDSLINQLMIEWGMAQTDLENNLTTAGDVALFFKKLYQKELLGVEFSNKMIEDLTNTAYEDRIPQGVPEGIQVAHKVGSETGVVSDAGIIFTPKDPFVLVVLSQNTAPKAAQENFPEIVKEIYWAVVGG